MTAALQTFRNDTRRVEIKPMRLLESLVLFGTPAMALALSLLWFWPYLVRLGMPRAGGYALSLGIVNLGLLIASLAGYVMEGNPLTLKAFCVRMRLSRMSLRIWIWAILGTLLFGALGLLIEPFAQFVYRTIHFTIPDVLAVRMSLGLHAITLFFNIVGEELWWRGYILPRQELAFGKNTWLLHGTLWAFFHMFKWYAVPFMLITCQIIPYIAQRTKNTWPGIINHLVINTASIILFSA